MNGWYYDRQLENRLTSVTLHANQEYNRSKKEWYTPSPQDESIWMKDETWVTDKGEYMTQGYLKEPISRSILTEDLNVSVANTWSAYGGDFLSGAWETFRTAAPYAPALESGFKALSDSLGEDLKNNENDRAGWVNTVEGMTRMFADTQANNLHLFNRRLNDHLVTQGTRFSYYSGSGVAFGGLGMRYTVFPKIEVGRFISVIDQIKTLLPYVNGQLEEETKASLMSGIEEWKNGLKTEQREKFKKQLEELKKDQESFAKADTETKFTESWKKIKSTVSEIAGTTYSKVSSIADDVLSAIFNAGLLYWQKAPGGFKPFYKDIDMALQGTLKLIIGSKYSISSLVCQDATFNFSKIMVKNPYDNTISPLYCDVNLTLMPSTKFSNISLENFISGNYVKFDESEQIEKKISDSLQMRVEKNKSYYV